jgi:MoxR-like ATPase
MATQNPIETEGTYPLPEAQIDRFMMKVLVDYPSQEEEFAIVDRVTRSLEHGSAVASPEQLNDLQAECRKSYVDPALIGYAVRLVGATRDPEAAGIADTARYISFGASPRASIHLIEAARALGFLRGRAYVLPQDVVDVAPDVLRHRIIRTYDALADGVTSEELLRRIMSAIKPPEAPLERHVELTRT